MTATFTAMVSGGFDLNLLVLDFPRPDRCSDADWWATLRAFEAALKANKAQGRDRRLAAGEPAGRIRSRADARAASCRCSASPRRMDAAEAAAFIGAAWREPQAQPMRYFGCRRAWRRRHITPDEAEAKRGSSGPGLSVPQRRPRRQCRSRRCSPPMALGFPVALKALGVAHKSETRRRAAQSARRRIRQRGGRTISARSAPASMSSAWCATASPS